LLFWTTICAPLISNNKVYNTPSTRVKVLMSCSTRLETSRQSFARGERYAHNCWKACHLAIPPVNINKSFEYKHFTLMSCHLHNSHNMLTHTELQIKDPLVNCMMLKCHLCSLYIRTRPHFYFWQLQIRSFKHQISLLWNFIGLILRMMFIEAFSVICEFGRKRTG